MTIAQLETLDGRRLLHAGMNVKPPQSEEPSEVEVRTTHNGNTSRDQAVGFDDLLTLAQNYNGIGNEFSQGDSNYNGTVNFDDLLALAQNYGSTGTVIDSSSFAQDWALRMSMVGGPEPTPVSTMLRAKLVDDALVIEAGSYGDIELRASQSRTGRLRIFGRDAANGESELISVKASKVQNVRVVDGPESHSITLAAGFPKATIDLNGGNDKLIANARANIIHGGAGDDTIYAGGGDDVVYGGEGLDSLYGEGGTDVLDGGAQKDFLDGGSGRNRLVGGSGTDKFVVRSNKDRLDREDRDHVSTIS